MIELTWKDSFEIICPYCGHEEYDTMYLNIIENDYTCNKCEKSFYLELWASDVKMKSIKKP